MIRYLHKRSWKLWDAPRPIAKAKGQMFGRRHHQTAEESIESVVRCGAYFEVGSRVAWNRKKYEGIEQIWPEPRGISGAFPVPRRFWCQVTAQVADPSARAPEGPWMCRRTHETTVEFHWVNFTGMMIDQRLEWGADFQTKSERIRLRAVALYSSNASMGSGFWIASLRRSRRRLLDLRVRRCVVGTETGWNRSISTDQRTWREAVGIWWLFMWETDWLRVLKHCRCLPERIAPLSSRVVPYVSSGAWQIFHIYLLEGLNCTFGRVVRFFFEILRSCSARASAEASTFTPNHDWTFAVWLVAGRETCLLGPCMSTPKNTLLCIFASNFRLIHC